MAAKFGWCLRCIAAMLASLSLLKRAIMSNTNEKDVEMRENGEILEMKVALQLGRNLSELKHLAA